MKLVDIDTFSKLAGKTIPLRRNTSTFDGDSFQCACGNEHIFSSFDTSVIAEGFNGKLIINCPSKPQYINLIKTKMKWGFIYQGLEYIAGCKNTEINDL